MKNIVLAVFVISAIITLVTMLKTKRFFSALTLTVIQGFIALVAANLIGGYIGVHLSLNIFTITVSLLGGTPGVIMLLLIDAILT